jgi:hypothetical protein
MLTEPIDTAVLIRQIGALLWGPGPGWPAAMAEALGGVNIRTVRRWASGQQIPPTGIWQRLLEILAGHRGECEAAEGAIAQILQEGERQ